MPTINVSIEFNPDVLKILSSEKALTYEQYIFSVKHTGHTSPDALLKGNRWFHCEFWSVDNGIETYTRNALFGSFEVAGGELRFFIGELTNSPFNDSASPAARPKPSAHDLEALKRDLTNSTLHQVKKIEADISWHELEQSKLCQCFAKKERWRSTHERLQALSKARPVGRVYFMYCFSLNEYFMPVGEPDKPQTLTEAETQAVERSIFKFYTGRDCQLHKKILNVEVSKETNPNGAHNGKATLTPLELVEVTKREAQLNNDSIDFLIFRTKVRNNDWLNNKTYRLTINEEFEYFLRLSNTGLIEVRQEMRLTGERKSLAKILEELLRFRRVDIHGERETSIKGERDTNVPLELNSIVEGFAKCLIRMYRWKLRERRKKTPAAQLSTEGKTSGQGRDYQHALPPPPVRFKSKIKAASEPQAETGSEAQTENKKLDRDRRYVTIVLRDLLCGNKLSRTHPVFCGRSIKPSDVHYNIEAVSGFLEGTMVYDERSDELQIPSRPGRDPGELPDLSNWSEEICFFEADRALIYFETKTILESYNYVANYEAYWRAVVRGIEHQLSVRTCLQNMETTTTKLTEAIPGLLLGLGNSGADKKRREESKDELDKLASNVSQVMVLLPKLRQISTTATAFRSEKAVTKFDRLGRVCFQFPEMLGNIQQNVDELGNFLQYAKSQQLRIDIDTRANEEKKSDANLVRVGLLIAVSSIFFASFSFLVDAASFFNNYPAGASPFTGRMRLDRPAGFFNSTGTKAFFVYLILLSALTAFIVRFPRYLYWLSTKRQDAKFMEGRPSKWRFVWAFLAENRVDGAGLIFTILLLFVVIWWG